MISRLTKIQLVIFAIVTVLGGAFVGGRYAQIDRLFVDRSYPVSAQFKDSGGIFAGAQVTYRGIPVGKVGKLDFQDSGVRATLDIENSAPKIPSDVLAVVANKSAIGEQFVDLQPRSNNAPYLGKGSAISQANTRIPIDTTTLLVDTNDLVRSVNTDSLRTVVSEFGKAFEGTGQDLSTILDTSSEFIQAADDNIDVTRALINDSSSVLQTQIDSQDDLGTFSTNLALLSDSLVDADPDLRRLLDKGSVSARTLREVVDENSDDLSSAVRDLVIANRPLSENILGLQANFILYPYLVEGSYSVLQPEKKKAANGSTNYTAAFGVVATANPPTCTYAQTGGKESGYYQRRSNDQAISDRPDFPTTVDCIVKNNTIARQESKTVLKRTAASTTISDGSTGSAPTGKDSWKWLLLGPATQ